MSKASEQTRLSLLRILADLEILPSTTQLAALLGLKLRPHARYYLQRLAAGGFILIEDFYRGAGLVERRITMTDSAWEAIDQPPPDVPKVFSRTWQQTTGGLRKAPRCPAPKVHEMKEDLSYMSILASIRVFDRDWNGDGCRSAGLEDLRRRAARRALTTGGQKPQHPGTSEELSS